MSHHVSWQALAVVAACVLLMGSACSSVSLVDEVTIVNNSEYAANVDVTGSTRDGWLGLTFVEPQSSTTVKDVIDQGDVWIFRFDYAGKFEEVEISRRELARNDWTIEVPQTFEQRLRDLDVPPPP